MNEALQVLFSPAAVVWLAPLLLVVTAHFLAEPLRWHLYLACNVEGGLLRLVHIFSLTAFIGYTMPLKMGLPVRIWLLRSRAGVSLSRTSSILVLDGLLYYAAWGLCACLALAAFGSHLALSAAMTRGMLAAALALVALLAAWLLWSRRGSSGVAAGRFARLRERVAAFRNAARETRSGAVFAAVLVALLDIASHVLRHTLLLLICGVSLDPGAVTLVACVSVFVGLISLMPMGLGGYDVTLVLLLSRLGVAPEVGLMVAVLNRVSTIGVGCGLGVWGGLALGLHPFRRDWLERVRS